MRLSFFNYSLVAVAITGLISWVVAEAVHPEKGARIYNSESAYENSHIAQKSQVLLLGKIDAMQQEIQQLRGKLEVQGHDLKLLNEQQRAFYRDLDKRISRVTTNVANKSASSKTAPGEAKSLPATSSVAAKLSKTSQKSQKTQTSPKPQKSQSNQNRTQQAQAKRATSQKNTQQQAVQQPIAKVITDKLATTKTVAAQATVLNQVAANTVTQAEAIVADTAAVAINAENQSTSTPTTVVTAPTVEVVETAPTAEDASSRYRAAYKLVETKQFQRATTAMQKFIDQYPNNEYTANALYWLGELYLLDNQLAAAESEFNDIVTKFPKSTKVSGALYKLGIIYSRRGEIYKAQKAFINIKQQFPGTAVARLSANKLIELEQKTSH